jgi:hypothetical protein
MKNTILSESDFRKDVIRVDKKPEICPVCGSKRIAAYLYGLPMLSDELDKEISEGKIVLGSCCITDDDPYFRCLECGADFYLMINPL